VPAQGAMCSGAHDGGTSINEPGSPPLAGACEAHSYDVRLFSYDFRLFPYGFYSFHMPCYQKQWRSGRGEEGSCADFSSCSTFPYEARALRPKTGPSSPARGPEPALSNLEEHRNLCHAFWTGTLYKTSKNIDKKTPQKSLLF
jgi:hypothetical protein